MTLSSKNMKGDKIIDRNRNAIGTNGIGKNKTDDKL